MKKLLSYVVLAIGIIAGYKKTIAAQKAEIDRLQKIIDDENFDDEEREAKLAELESFEAEAASKAEDLAALLNDEPAVPTVDVETFDVTEQPTAPPQDLAFREREAETAGAAAGSARPGSLTSVSTPAGAPAGQGEGEGSGETETAETLASSNSKDSLIALAEKEGVDVKNSDTKDVIAAAIVAKRAEGAGA